MARWGIGTVAATRGQRIAVGDLVISRRNDPSITVHAAGTAGGRVDAVRNGQRWRVAAVGTATNRLAAQRLDDGARAVFGGQYLRAHVGLGYAVTVHASQGVTVGTTHAVLAENATRCLFYVAMTRGREANTVYLCQRTPEPDDHVVTDGAHVAVRGSGSDAARVARAVLSRNDVPGTAHQLGADAASPRLPDRVARFDEPAQCGAVAPARRAHRAWLTATTVQARAADRSNARDRSRDHGLEL